MTLVNTETGEITEPLSAMERSDLTHKEAVIERGLKTFVEVGEALAEIRDAELYREDYGTFEAYLEGRWGLSRGRGYQLIDASETTRQMSTMVDTPTPTSERQARELSGLDPESAAQAMRDAHEQTGGKVTAKAIRQARKKNEKPDPDDDIVDGEIVEDDEPEERKRTNSGTPEPESESQDLALINDLRGPWSKGITQAARKMTPKARNHVIAALEAVLEEVRSM